MNPAIPFIPMVPPPLPLGWSEHIGPNGQPYYFNAHTNESTYTRPLPAFPVLNPQTVVQQQQPQKKEKPLVKTPIPGTDWIRVKTTLGNTFYSHKVDKRSVWTIPDEIKDAVNELEKGEKEVAEEKSKVETERVKPRVSKDTVKRKAEDPVPVDEVIISKKARVEDDVDEDDDDENEETENEDEEESEEEWQKEAAAQLAAEAESLRRKEEEEKLRAAELAAQKADEEAKRNPPPLNMPARVDLSIEEGKTLFKTLLREKDINPLHPWDTALPLFISDPRYVLLPSVSARREAFDEYCRDRARELREAKVWKDKEDPKEQFENLLNQVQSTRASWSDFRRQWKKDRRFYAWGRDDREREKRFKEYLKELGEKKRAAAQKAEIDFFALLKESEVASQDLPWKDVKRKISHERRYEAVGSSSLREELYNTFLKGTASYSTSKNSASSSRDDSRDVMKEDKAVRAVRERQDKVRQDMNRVEADIGRSRKGLNKEEDERDFRSLLTDAVWDPQATWKTAYPQLSKDPRFIRSTLSTREQFQLFDDHLANIRAKHLANLHVLFESHAPSLAIQFSDLPLDSLLSSVPATKLGLTKENMRDEYHRWLKKKTSDARNAFGDMMSENSFLEFWGRLGKIGGKGVDETIQNDDIGEKADEDGELVDMKKLAKAVDVTDIIKVLKNDKRYIMFDYIPEERERWVREYVAKMKPPQLSVHVPERS